MAFPTIPTGAQVLVNFQANATTTRTFQAFSGLTHAAGDLLIAICIGYQSNATNAAFSSWSNSFNEFIDSGSPTTMAIGAAYKFTAGGETGSLTVTQASPTGTNSHAAMILMAIPGAHASTPPEGGSRADGTGAAADSASFDPGGWAAEDTLWIGVCGSGEDSATGAYTGVAGTPPTNYSGMQETGISADVVGGVEGGCAFRQLNASSEDIGVFSVDITQARNAEMIIAVRPAAAPALPIPNIVMAPRIPS